MVVAEEKPELFWGVHTAVFILLFPLTWGKWAVNKEPCSGLGSSYVNIQTHLSLQSYSTVPPVETVVSEMHSAVFKMALAFNQCIWNLIVFLATAGAE